MTKHSNIWAHRGHSYSKHHARVGSLTRIVLIALIPVGDPSQVWAAPSIISGDKKGHGRWKMTCLLLTWPPFLHQADLLRCCCCCWFLHWCQSQGFPGFHHWLQTKSSSPGTCQVFCARVEVARLLALWAERLPGCWPHTTWECHCGTSPGLPVLKDPVTARFSISKVWDNCYYFQVR